MKNKELGQWGERVAVDYLLNKNYKIIDTNYACRYGEIDIIAQNKRAIIFVEVKTRRNIYFGWPEEAVTEEKRGKMERVAEYFLLSNKLTKKSFYFDVISILAGDNKEIKEIKHLQSI